jgi:hypothetical protein
VARGEGGFKGGGTNSRICRPIDRLAGGICDRGHRVWCMVYGRYVGGMWVASTSKWYDVLVGGREGRRYGVEDMT